VRIQFIISILVGLGALAACAKTGNEQPADQPGSAAPSPSRSAGSTPLETTRWRLAELNGRQATVVEGRREPHLIFDADSARVGGATGCNLLGGPFTSSGDSLTFGALITTKMACMESNLMDQERDFLGALSNTARYEIRGDTLLLKGRDDQPLARLVAVAG
jgi:heat shock protein HslJ